MAAAPLDRLAEARFIGSGSDSGLDPIPVIVQHRTSLFWTEMSKDPIGNLALI